MQRMSKSVSLKEKIDALKVKMQVAINKEDKQLKKNEHRKKYLLGQCLSEKNGYEYYNSELDNFLFKSRDRELFNLLPRE